MSRAAKERAEAVAELPHVKKWMREFEALAKKMPPEVWVYVASGTPWVMALNEHGKFFETPASGSDPDACIESFRHGHWDGGDW